MEDLRMGAEMLQEMSRASLGPRTREGRHA